MEPWPRLPLEPLVRVARTVWRPTATNTPAGPGGALPFSDRDLADVLGVNRRSVARWRRGGMPEPTADRAAVELGLHPSLVWPDWWEVTHREHDEDEVA